MDLSKLDVYEPLAVKEQVLGWKIDDGNGSKKGNWLCTCRIK